ncbi:FAD binding domain protein [Apiospora marii]|uniref:FAD binding domain protein n=1 Tax=Apiospora marii TaxID=335849 RepID=UPI00312F393D
MSSIKGEPPFRVIIVGGGVAGLTAAHCLHQAGIDYVILERGQFAPALGASIALYPQGTRILEQIGCLDAVEEVCKPLGKSLSILPSGKVILRSDTYDYVRKSFGYPISVLDRRRFLDILYHHLPDKSKAKAGSEVCDVIDTSSGVKVMLKDGSTEEGDMVLGCDGVHSLVRSLMWRNANLKVPGLISATEKTSLYCDWTVLVGFSPWQKGWGLGDYDTAVHHQTGKSILVMGGKQHIYWFIFFRNDQRRTWPVTSPRYTEQDVLRRANECASWAVSDTMVFGELWKQRSRAELVNVEEGLFEHMYFGRTVLAGDSVAKMTPNLGLGGNTAIESVASLVNLLHAAVQQAGSGSKPGPEAVEKLLSDYQAERRPRVKEAFDLSKSVTRFQARDSPFHYAMAHLAPYLPDASLANMVKPFIRAAVKLDFVTATGNRQGTVPWDTQVASKPALARRKHQKGDGTGSSSWGSNSAMGGYAVLGFVLFCSLYAYLGHRDAP